MFLLYIREIERDPTKQLNFANVLDRGKHDTLIAEAKVNAAMFFRTRGGEPRPGGAARAEERAVWNGKATASSQKCCVPWNMGKPHPAAHLQPDGTCMHAHVCMQFVTDKGPGGQCRGNHARTDCDYPIAKRSRSPAK